MKVTNVRYGKLGKVLFEHGGVTHTIKEPSDVLLVGVENEEDPELKELWENAADRWIHKHYGYLLDFEVLPGDEPKKGKAQ